jgi:GTPase SAR1 family protein
MESKKNIALDGKIYQHLLAQKKNGETVEDVIARLLDGASRCEKSSQSRVPCKIVVLGPPASGKSMLVKFFFENKDPRNILSDFLLPTKTTEEITYIWLDLVVMVVDVGHDDFEGVIAGQQQQQSIAGAREIIYVLDMNTWEAQKNRIIADMDALLKIQKILAPISEISLILHKKDTLEPPARDAVIADVKQQIKEHGWEGQIHVHATSLVSTHAVEAFRSIRTILFKHSSLLRQALLPGFLRS